MRRPKTSLLTKEDYLAIWIGFFIIITGLLVYFTSYPSYFKTEHQRLEKIMAHELEHAPFKTIAYYQALDKQEELKAEQLPAGKFLNKLTGNTHTWSNNPLKAFYLTEKQAKDTREKWEKEYEQKMQEEAEAFANAAQTMDKARAAEFENKDLNQEAKHLIGQWLKAKENLLQVEKKYEIKAYNQVSYLLLLFIIFALLFGVGSWFLGIKFPQFIKGFTFIFIIAVLAFLLASNQTMKTIGFGYAAWAIVIGLIISNTIGTPEFVKPAVQTEFYIKTGLVILGAEILLGKIMAIGLPGIFVAWIVTPVVLITTYWFGQKILKISSKTLNITISADMSVCGVSAAVATAAACNAKKEELTLAIGLSMFFTSIMMILLPIFINWVGMPEVLGGAWLGGTIDATGAVVAAGAFLGDTALAVAATIKMIQNVLIGIVAFFVAVYFAYKVEKKDNKTIGAFEIWKRFPKFILGFIGASILFTVIYSLLGENMGYSLIDQGVIGGFTKNIRGWLFNLAFVSIGLATNFKELKKYFKGGKPLILYLIGQSFNILLTLLMAYIMFYLIFPEITNAL